MDAIDRQLGAAIRAGRKRRNLTQKELARRSGVSLRHLAAIERGANFTVAVLFALASELDEVAFAVIALLAHRLTGCRRQQHRAA